MPNRSHHVDFATLVNSWLRERIADAELDADGVASLMRDEQTFILIEVLPASTVCHFYAPVAPLPEFDPESGLLAAMELNRYGRPLGGCWLAWDPDIQMLMLCYNLTLPPTDSISFWNTVDNFIAALDIARDQLSPAHADKPLLPAEARSFVANV